MMEQRLSAAAEPFDVLGAEYECAYGHLLEQLMTLDWLLARLPRGAKVLDIGSGRASQWPTCWCGPAAR
jgi:hypothetical protein